MDNPKPDNQATPHSSSSSLPEERTDEMQAEDLDAPISDLHGRKALEWAESAGERIASAEYDGLSKHVKAGLLKRAERDRELARQYLASALKSARAEGAALGATLPARSSEARNSIATLLNRLVLASIAKGEQRHVDIPAEDRITDEDLDGYEGKILGLVDDVLWAKARSSVSQTEKMPSGCHGNSASGDAERQSPVAAWWPIATAPQMRKVIVSYLNDLGKRRAVMACYYRAHSLEMDDDYMEVGDYDDATGESFAPEGWYEEHDSDSPLMPLQGEPTHWMPLPAPPTDVDGGEPQASSELDNQATTQAPSGEARSSVSQTEKMPSGCLGRSGVADSGSHAPVAGTTQRCGNCGARPSRQVVSASIATCMDCRSARLLTEQENRS